MRRVRTINVGVFAAAVVAVFIVVCSLPRGSVVSIVLLLGGFRGVVSMSSITSEERICGALVFHVLGQQHRTILDSFSGGAGGGVS